MKDPAFLFYPGDWMGGTQWMNMEEKGCYIELLVLQFNTGQFTEAQAKQVLNTSFNLAWPTIKQKFRSDNGFFWNERLRYEIEKRKKFSESRRKNALNPKKKKASVEDMPEHMENENEIRNIIIYLNEKTNKNFKPNSKVATKFINARINDGYKYEDFTNVIDKKAKSWLNDPEMNLYLRPETLFSNKFESYLNENITIEEPTKMNEAF